MKMKTCQKLQNATKAVIRNFFKALKAMLEKNKCFQISALSFYLRKLGKEKQIEPKESIRKEIRSEQKSKENKNSGGKN